MLKTEGIIVQSLPFQDTAQILSVFSPDLGLAKIVLKRAVSCSPLTRAEWIYRETSSDLLTSKEMTITDTFPKLRHSLEVLEAAGAMLQVIKETQIQGKPAKPLYQLLISYLHYLASFPYPPTLSNSFMLKCLRYEGWWHTTEEQPLLFVLGYSRSIEDLAGIGPLPAETIAEINALYIKAIR